MSTTHRVALCCVVGQLSEFAKDFVIADLLFIVVWNSLWRNHESNRGEHISFVAI